MQVSIRDASRYVIGAAVIRDMAIKNNPNSPITFENVVAMSLRDGNDGQTLRASIEKIADHESSWFRNTPPHTLTTERVLRTREQEVRTLNDCNLAVLTTLEVGPWAIAGKPEAKETLQKSLQAAVRAIDEIPGSTAERRALLQLLKADTGQIIGDPVFMAQELKTAQKQYLDNFREERLAAYTTPSLDRNDDLDSGM